MLKYLFFSLSVCEAWLSFETECGAVIWGQVEVSGMMMMMMIDGGSSPFFHEDR